MLFEVTGWNVSAGALKPETTQPKKKQKRKSKKDNKGVALKDGNEVLDKIGCELPGRLPESKPTTVAEQMGKGHSKRNVYGYGDGGAGGSGGNGYENDDFMTMKAVEEKPKISPDELQRLYEKSFGRGDKKDKKKGKNENQRDKSSGAIVAAGVEKEGGKRKKKRKRGNKGIEEEEENNKLESKQEDQAKMADREPLKKRRKISGGAKGEKRSDGGSTAATATAIKASELPPVSVEPEIESLHSLPSNSKLTPLQLKMRAKLTSARFRHINETLYTTPSTSSFSLFQEQPEMFKEYHAGYRQQVQLWPENPVDIFIDRIVKRAMIPAAADRRSKPNINGDNSTTDSLTLPLPSTKQHPKARPLTTIADLGCGDAKIARTLLSPKSPLPGSNKRLKMLSYDLSDVQHPTIITKVDIANLPLDNETVDIAIFCLALMGTNYLDFIQEAVRILRYGGECWIAEIKSRFTNSTKDETSSIPANRGKIGVKKAKTEENAKSPVVVEGGDADEHAIGISNGGEVYKPFVQALVRRGLHLRGEVDTSNKMFVRMEFVKVRQREDKRKDLGEDYDFSEVSRAGKGGRKRDMTRNMKFLEEPEEEIRKKEEKILKPCVYKIR